MNGSASDVSAVVTGGASGIGAACCRELASARRIWSWCSTATWQGRKRVAAEFGGRAYAVDVGDEPGSRPVAGADRGANAGRSTCSSTAPASSRCRCGPTICRWRPGTTSSASTSAAPMSACVAFARGMLARRRGSIVNIASIAGMRSMPLHAYAPAKAAVIAITECLAAEWGPAGVRVNAVSPGYTLHAGAEGRDRQGRARHLGTRRQRGAAAGWSSPTKSPASWRSWPPTRPRR